MRSVRRYGQDYAVWKRHISQLFYIAVAIMVLYVAYGNIAGRKVTDSATPVAATTTPANRFNFANQPAQQPRPPSIARTVPPPPPRAPPVATMNTQLMRAVRHNRNPEEITALIKSGANVNARDNDRMTPLMLAAEHNHNPEVITILVKAGADVNAKDIHGQSSLMWAAMKNRPEVITALIKSGADVDAKSSFGGTPLMAAARHNPNPEAITAILEAKADPKARSNSGRTARDFARQSPHLANTDALRKLEEASR